MVLRVAVVTCAIQKRSAAINHIGGVEQKIPILYQLIQKKLTLCLVLHLLRLMCIWAFATTIAGEDVTVVSGEGF